MSDFDLQQRRSCSPDEGIGSRSWSPPDPTGLTAVGQLVRRRVPEAVFLESIGQEITFVLPYSGARDGTFAQLFQDLDRNMSDLGLTSYGISDTTLEEVRRALTGASGRWRALAEAPLLLFSPPGSTSVRAFLRGDLKPAAR